VKKRKNRNGIAEHGEVSRQTETNKEGSRKEVMIKGENIKRICEALLGIERLMRNKREIKTSSDWGKIRVVKSRLKRYNKLKTVKQ